ncbi:MAG TPA: VOC family protein [Stellaceae bacterium]|jgi:catechol 2,3-dioxygenase-like lactoylglutathione lyase family enzyme
MDTTVAKTGAVAGPRTVAPDKPLLRGIHHLALNTGDMRMTLDFYVRILGMPIVHGLRTPVARGAHGTGTPPYAAIPHFFLDMGGDSLLAFFEYPRHAAKADRDALGAMQHVSFACGPKLHHEILERLKTHGVEITAGPLVIIPPAITSFYFFDPNGIRLEIVCDQNSDEADLDVIRSCRMSAAEMRAQLAGISDDGAWIDQMIAAMSR